MEFEVFTLAFGAVTSVAGAGIAWGSARTRLRNVEDDIESIDDRAIEHAANDVKQHTEIIDRLARLETVLQRIDRRIG